MTFRPARVLVTGGAGFIGSHYVRTLLTGGYPAWSGCAVTVLDKLTYAADPTGLAPVRADLTFVHGDVCDAGLLAEVVPGHDVVLNFASESHVDRSIDDARDFVRTNVLGVQALLQACLDAGVRKVVQVSTDEVYGSIEHGSWDENAPLTPNSPYAASKAGGDLIARSYAVTHGLPVCVTRCANNYGPYQHPEKVIPRFVTELLDGRPVPLYGDGRNVREWIHVDDHCRALQLVAEHGTPGETYNIAGDTELTNLALTELLLAELGAGPEMVRHVADRKGHDRRYSLNDAKVRRLGHAPRVAFATGLTETVQWYAAHRDWWEHRKPRPACQNRPKALLPEDSPR